MGSEFVARKPSVWTKKSNTKPSLFASRPFSVQTRQDNTVNKKELPKEIPPANYITDKMGWNAPQPTVQRQEDDSEIKEQEPDLMSKSESPVGDEEEIISPSLENENKQENVNLKPAVEEGDEETISPQLEQQNQDEETISPQLEDENKQEELNKKSIQTKLTVGEPGDKYEQEADTVAAKVVEQINSPKSQQPVQGKVEPVVQPTLMRQGGAGGGTVNRDVEQNIQQARGGGQGLADNVRQPMEQAFGADFSGVKVHTGGQADVLNRSLNSRAFATGQDIFFKQGEYNPGSRGGQELLAHELTHVVQQGGGAIQQQSLDTQEWKSPALQMRSQLRASPLSQLMIQRAVSTSGGEWDTDQYDLAKDKDENGNATPAAWGMRGLDIKIKFTPKDPADAELIGLTQTANTIQDNTPQSLTKTVASRSIWSVTTAPITETLPAGVVGAPRQIPAGTKIKIIRNAIPPSTNGRIEVVDGTFATQTLDITPADMANIQNEADQGAHIDMASPNTNPMYAVSSPSSASLDDPNTGATWGQHGWHYKDTSGNPQDQDATLIDTPRFDNAQTDSSQMFETTALATKGAQAGTYYGSVRWGWQTDSAGKFTKVPFTKVSDGVPSATFMKSAELWNASKTSTGADTLDLPIVDVKVTIAPINLIRTGGLVVSLLSSAEIQKAIRYNRRQGYNVEKIKKIQIIVGTPDDGIFGPDTVEKVSIWQSKNSLVSDGMVGPKTSAKMFGSSATPQSITLPVGTRVQVIQEWHAPLLNGTIKVVDGPLVGVTGEVNYKDWGNITDERS